MVETGTCYIHHNGYLLGWFAMWKPLDLEQMIVWLRYCGYERQHLLNHLDLKVLP